MGQVVGSGQSQRSLELLCSKNAKCLKGDGLAVHGSLCAPSRPTMFSSLAGLFLLLLPLSSSVRGAAIPRHDNDHDHLSQSSLPTAWFHNDDHPAHALFRRQSTPSSTFPVVGSSTWAAAYPAGTPVASQMPQPWIDALNAAVQAGKIPNVPPPTQTAASTTPIYAQGYNPNDPSVCSTSYGCRNPGDIFDAPNGVMAIGFDDGPLPVNHPLFSQFYASSNF